MRLSDGAGAQRLLARSLRDCPDPEGVREALMLGADACVCSEDFARLASSCAQEQAMECARLLMAEGAYPERGSAKASPFVAACRQGNWEFAELMAPYATSADLSKGLEFACRRADAEGIACCLRSGAWANGSFSSGRTPLGEACECDMGQSCAQALAHYGADPGKRDEFGLTPLMRAAAGAALGCMGALLSQGAAADAKTARGLSALDFALGHPHKDIAGNCELRHGHLLCAQKLLNAGCDWVSPADLFSAHMRLLSNAKRYEPAWFEMLRKAGADPLWQKPGYGGLLHMAGHCDSDANALEMCRWCVELGAQAGAPGKGEKLPWENAAAAGFGETAGFLLAMSEKEIAGDGDDGAGASGRRSKSI